MGEKVVIGLAICLTVVILALSMNLLTCDDAGFAASCWLTPERWRG